MAGFLSDPTLGDADDLEPLSEAVVEEIVAYLLRQPDRETIPDRLDELIVHHNREGRPLAAVNAAVVRTAFLMRLRS